MKQSDKSALLPIYRRQWMKVTGIAIIAVVIVAVIGIGILIYPEITRKVAVPGFVSQIENESSKYSSLEEQNLRILSTDPHPSSSETKPNPFLQDLPEYPPDILARRDELNTEFNQLHAMIVKFKRESQRFTYDEAEMRLRIFEQAYVGFFSKLADIWKPGATDLAYQNITDKEFRRMQSEYYKREPLNIHFPP